jgi:hypothetical protein
MQVKINFMNDRVGEADNTRAGFGPPFRCRTKFARDDGAVIR